MSQYDLNQWASNLGVTIHSTRCRFAARVHSGVRRHEQKSKISCALRSSSLQFFVLFFCHQFATFTNIVRSVSCHTGLSAETLALCSYKLSSHACLGYALILHRDRTAEICSSFNFTALSSFQPNYAIKRDFRAYIRFKFYIGRVSPLFWLLGGISKKQIKLALRNFFLLLSVLLS